MEFTDWDDAIRRNEVESPRECDEWFPYTVGFSPAEHLEELRLRRLEQERREFEARMEADRRRWEVQMNDTNEDREKEIRKVGYWIAAAGIFLAIAQTVVGVIALVIASK